MTIDTAVTLFREIAIGEKFACAILFDGARCIVQVPLRIWESGEQLTEPDVLKLVALARRYEQSYWNCPGDEAVFVIGISRKTDEWPVKLSEI